MAAGNYNIKNTAIKRIHADVRELQREPSDQYHAAPLEENLFEWHFTIRGPPSTEFEGGIYHGRIILPTDYPFKPPNIVLLTPNGRFKVGDKICLSISAHHPEYWQPAWGVRLILEALISFLPTEGKGALGSLDWTPEERRKLAQESQEWVCAKCGLARSLLPEEQGGEGAHKENKYLEQIAQLHVHGVPASPDKPETSSKHTVGKDDLETKDEDSTKQDDSGTSTQEASSEKVELSEEKSPDNSTEARISGNRKSQVPKREEHTNSSCETPSQQGAPASAPTSMHTNARPTTSQPQGSAPDRRNKEDDNLLYVIYCLVIAILALLIRKIMRTFEIST